MKLFVWHRLDQVTDNYHTEGGLVIIAESLDRAKLLASGEKYIVIDREPDETLDVGEAGEYLRVFPDAGCC